MVVSARQVLPLSQPTSSPRQETLVSVEEPTGPPAYDSWVKVRSGLKSSGQWERAGRKVPSPRPRPAAYMGHVPLYSESQTRPYNPKPATVAFWETADFLMRFLTPLRDYYSYKPRGDPDAKGWPRVYSYLSEQTFRDALSGKEVLALFHAGGHAFWFALDVDFHPGDLDRDRFLRRLAAVHDELTAQGEDWFAAGINPEKVSGCHFYVLSAEPLPLRDVLGYAQAMKTRLIQKHPDLFDDTLEVYPTVGGNPLRMPVCKGRCLVLDRPLEVVPLREQAACLADWIRNPGRPMLKDEFVAWFAARTPEHRPPSFPVNTPSARPASVAREEIGEEEFLAGLDGPTERYDGPKPDNYESMTFQEWFAWAWAEACKSSGVKDDASPVITPLARQTSVPPGGMREPRHPVTADTEVVPASPASVGGNRTTRQGTLQSTSRPGSPAPSVSFKGRFFEIMDHFWHSRLEPKAGMIGSYVGPWVRWAVACGCRDEEIAGFLRRQLPLLEYPGLSGRLEEDIEELVRCEVAAARRVRLDNGYQPDAVRSEVIFAGVVAASRRLGIDPLDLTSFGRYRAAASKDWEVHEAHLDEEQARVVLGAAGWPSMDTAVVLAVAKRVVGHVGAYPDREMAAVFLPVLCDDLGLEWACPSDEGRRCKKAERVLKALVDAGVLIVKQDAVWHGRKKPGNRARLYGLGPVMGVEGEAVEVALEQGKEKEGGSVSTIGETSPCSPVSRFEPLRKGLRRLRRKLGPTRVAREENDFDHQMERQAC